MQEVLLKEYLDRKNDFANAHADVFGYLKHGVYQTSSSNGIYTEMVTDKKGNDILLIGLDDAQKQLFTPKGVTGELFHLTGTFKNHVDGFKIDVASIDGADAPVRTVETTLQVPEQITRTVKVPIDVNATNIKKALWTTKQTILGVCSDGTKRGACTATPPGYCNAASVIIDNPGDCGCPDGHREYKGVCVPIVECEDGTLEPECSSNQPNQCLGGKLVQKSSVCGCPDDYNYRKMGETCQKISRCEDGTIYDECATTKPLRCESGKLVERASMCGCKLLSAEAVDGDRCVSQYETKPAQRTVRVGSNTVQITTYGGLNDHLHSLDRSIWTFQGAPLPTDKDFIMKALNNPEQKKYLTSFTELFRTSSASDDQQAKNAIRFVQQIPYDYAAFNSGNISGKYPYEVLYTNTGVCSEKAQLLAYLLRDLGYGTAILRFDEENHDAVGIKCPLQYQYKNTGYCFVESTQPTAIGDSSQFYIGVGQLKSTPEVIVISEGKTLKSIN